LPVKIYDKYWLASRSRRKYLLGIIKPAYAKALPVKIYDKYWLASRSRRKYLLGIIKPAYAKASADNLLRRLVPPAGFEPATFGSEDRHSIQLSYGGM
jgi:hypothetical protein